MFVQPGKQRWMMIPGATALSHRMNPERFVRQVFGTRIVETDHLQRMAQPDESRRKIPDHLARPAGLRIHAADDVKQFHEFTTPAGTWLRTRPVELSLA